MKEFLRCGAPTEIVDICKDYKAELISSIKLYYQGNIIESQLKINKLINEFSDDNTIAISGVNDSIAFMDNSSNSNIGEVQFFRARLNDKVLDFSAKEMLHIPFKMRQIVKSGRFSIPGLPCLYLGNSSYSCWIEMGRPADFQFNVSPVILDNTQKILNLTVSIRDLIEIQELEEVVEDSILQERLVTMIKLLILNISTSYRISEQNRNFKSEYILAQMIMLASKSRGLDGILYFSKQVEDELFASVVGINLVLFATYNGEEEFSEICEHLDIGDSFNFSMFKQLLHSLTYNNYDLRIMHSGKIKNIGTFNRKFPYAETAFFEFDKYLFANWNRNKND